MFTGATSQGDEVVGMTVLQEELFLVRHLATDVEVYDGVTLNLQRRLAIDGLVWPVDMASSVKYKCLYIAGRHHVYRLQLDDDVTTSWPLKEKPHSLSSTPDGSNVIVTYRAANKLIEYTTHGNQVREICLKGDIIKPIHAVQLTTGNEFVVSQGEWSDPQLSVYVVGADGCVRRSFGGPRAPASGQLNLAGRFVVDRSGSVLLSDVYNQRIVVIGSLQNYVRELVSRHDLDRFPSRLCLDERRGVLYAAVGEWSGNACANSHVLAFQVKDKTTGTSCGVGSP